MSQRLGDPGEPKRRSRRGCPECRRRKIKCDEQQPECGQCYATKRKCRLQDSLFKPSDFTLRYSKSNQPASVASATSPDSSYNDLNKTRCLCSPKAIEANSDAGQDTAPTSSFTQASLHHSTGIPQDKIPDIVPVPNFQNINEQTSPALAGQISWSNCEGQPRRENPVPHESTPDLHILGDYGEEAHTDLYAVAIESLRNTQEELFLLRHYSECIAPWMDLLYRYEVFSREVLTLAREHPILRYAACAVAAKQLGQLRKPLSNMIRSKTQHNIAVKLQNGRLGLLWYGAKYYEKAIQTLVQSITPKDTTQRYSSGSASLSQGNLMVHADGEDPIVRLLGTCILIQYEQLSANRDTWSGHLFGFSKLLNLVDDGKLLLPDPEFEAVYPFTKAVMQVKAGFWNFVVNDLEESFVSEQPTRIDTENLALWRNMGLLIEDDGGLTTCAGPNSLSNAAEHARDKAISYALIRLLCKLIDYLAPSSQLETAMVQPLLDPRKANFISLENHFQAWHQTISLSFLADGTFVTHGNEQETTSELFRRELWFSNDLCATTMLFYHMASMLLLIHRPSDLLHGGTLVGNGSSFDLLRAFRDIQLSLQSHASEVISIVRGTPCDAVRLRAIQPLYVAGRCCNSSSDRKMLVGVLRDIEDDLGIATGYRIDSLLGEWGISYEDIGLEHRGRTTR